MMSDSPALDRPGKCPGDLEPRDTFRDTFKITGTVRDTFGKEGLDQRRIVSPMITGTLGTVVSRVTVPPGGGV